MLSNLGNILLFGSIFITLSIIYFAYQNLKEKNILIGKNLVYLSFFQITFIIASFLLLIFASAGNILGSLVSWICGYFVNFLIKDFPICPDEPNIKIES